MSNWRGHNQDSCILYQEQWKAKQLAQQKAVTREIEYLRKSVEYRDAAHESIGPLGVFHSNLDFLSKYMKLDPQAIINLSKSLEFYKDALRLLVRLKYFISSTYPINSFLK